MKPSDLWTGWGLWGALGAALGYALVELIPILRAVAHGKAKARDFNWFRLLGYVGLAVVKILLGAAAGAIVGEDVKTAIVAGAGCEALFTGFLTPAQPVK